MMKSNFLSGCRDFPGVMNRKTDNARVTRDISHAVLPTAERIDELSSIGAG